MGKLYSNEEVLKNWGLCQIYYPDESIGKTVKDIAETRWGGGDITLFTDNTFLVRTFRDVYGDIEIDYLREPSISLSDLLNLGVITDEQYQDLLSEEREREEAESKARKLRSYEFRKRELLALEKELFGNDEPTGESDETR